MNKQEIEFIRDHPRAVLVTHRRDGGIQASPIRVLIDAEGGVVATTRAATAKAHNLARDPNCALCVLNEEWRGAWLTLEANASVIELPEALESLRAFYLARDGEVSEPEVFERTMRDEGRVILRFTPIRAAGPALTSAPER